MLYFYKVCLYIPSISFYVTSLWSWLLGPREKVLKKNRFCFQGYPSSFVSQEEEKRRKKAKKEKKPV